MFNSVFKILISRLKTMYSTKNLVVVLLLVFLFACKDDTITVIKKQSDESTLFSLISEEHSNIHFKNSVTEDMDFNVEVLLCLQWGRRCGW